MRQETGNNATAANEKVSIQFNLGGHSFSATELPTEVLGSSDNVLFSVATHKVTLVPRCAFEESLSAQYLAAVGLSCDDGETTVCSEMQAETIAVMAIDRNVLDGVLDVLGTRARFTTPLLDERHDGNRNLSIRVADGVAYFRLFDNALRLAEAERVKTADDVLFYALQFLQSAALGTDTDIYIGGDRTAAKVLKRYFKRVVCE